ncbi:fimbrial protein [Erwinia sp. Eh17-17]|jgi:type 1 fimbria pilin|uniref:fimbrial protein n=1 Tax=Erwinia sp. Eh17-17 TaxID=3080330 RepID=UPI003209C3AE
MYAKIGISALVLFSIISGLNPVFASQPLGWGRVKMLGAILETACAIDTESRDQTIDMGFIPTVQIIRAGHSIDQPLTIKLVNCMQAKKSKNTPDGQHYQITFEGRNDTGLFGLNGDAQGVALQIVDGEGNVAIPGLPLPKRNATQNEMPLQYSLRLVSNHKLLLAGEYFSTVKFKMDYY